MSLRVSKPNPYTKYRVLNHVSILSIPQLDNSILKFHTHIVSIPVIFFFPSFFSSLLLLLLLLLLLFSSPLSVCLFSKTKMRYLFWYYPYLILSPFYFNFFFLFISLFLSFEASLTIRSKYGSFLPLSFKPLVSSTIFFLIYLFDFFNIFLLLLFGPQFHFIKNPTLAYELIKL